MNGTGYLILQENRVVLASVYRNIAVSLPYARHLELTKNKELLRSKLLLASMEKTITQVLGLYDFFQIFYPVT